MNILYNDCRVCRSSMITDSASIRMGGLCSHPLAEQAERGCFERFWRWMTQGKNQNSVRAWSILKESQGRNHRAALKENDIMGSLKGHDSSMSWNVLPTPMEELPEFQMAVENWIELGAPDTDGIRHHLMF